MEQATSASFEERKQTSATLRKNHPNRVPIIIKKHKKSKLKTEASANEIKVLALDDNKIYQLLQVIRSKLKLGKSDALYLFVNESEILRPNADEIYQYQHNIELAPSQYERDAAAATNINFAISKVQPTYNQRGNLSTAFINNNNNNNLNSMQFKFVKANQYESKTGQEDQQIDFSNLDQIMCFQNNVHQKRTWAEKREEDNIIRNLDIITQNQKLGNAQDGDIVKNYINGSLPRRFVNGNELGLLADIIKNQSKLQLRNIGVKGKSVFCGNSESNFQKHILIPIQACNELVPKQEVESSDLIRAVKGIYNKLRLRIITMLFLTFFTLGGLWTLYVIKNKMLDKVLDYAKEEDIEFQTDKTQYYKGLGDSYYLTVNIVGMVPVAFSILYLLIITIQSYNQFNRLYVIIGEESNKIFI